MQKHGVAYCYNLDEIIQAQLPDLEAYWNEQMEMEANANVDYKEIWDTLSQVDVSEYVEEKMNLFIFME